MKLRSWNIDYSRDTHFHMGSWTMIRKKKSKQIEKKSVRLDALSSTYDYSFVGASLSWYHYLEPLNDFPFMFQF